MASIEKYFAKFEKITQHLGGNTPFWDYNFSGTLKITKSDETLWLGPSDLLKLKKLLKDFDGRKAKWKNEVQKK